MTVELKCEHRTGRVTTRDDALRNAAEIFAEALIRIETERLIAEAAQEARS